MDPLPQHVVRERKAHLTYALHHLRHARAELLAVGADIYDLNELIEETDNAVSFYDRLRMDA